MVATFCNSLTISTHDHFEDYLSHDYTSPLQTSKARTDPTMRFQDWDVLLFPHGSHVPIREFRTACFAQQDTRTMSTTPLLTCFVPSLTANAPFQVSVHTWVKPASILGANNAGYVAGAKYQWRIKIVVEGNAIANETFPEDVDWPRQIGALPA